MSDFNTFFVLVSDLRFLLFSGVTKLQKKCQEDKGVKSLTVRPMVALHA